MKLTKLTFLCFELIGSRTFDSLSLLLLASSRTVTKKIQNILINTWNEFSTLWTLSMEIDIIFTCFEFIQSIEVQISLLLISFRQSKYKLQISFKIKFVLLTSSFTTHWIYIFQYSQIPAFCVVVRIHFLCEWKWDTAVVHSFLWFTFQDLEVEHHIAFWWFPEVCCTWSGFPPARSQHSSSIRQQGLATISHRLAKSSGSRGLTEKKTNYRTQKCQKL